MNASVTQAILPVGGLGTRFLPWTKAVPKEMLPLGTHPIIALIVDECLQAGIRDICFVLSPGKELIPQFFKKDEKLEAELRARGKEHLLSELLRYDEARFHTVYQEKPLGDGHAILQAREWVTSDEVAVLFGDDLFIGGEGATQQLIRGFAETKEHGERAIVAVEDIPRELTSRYGILDPMPGTSARLFQAKGLVEKPAPKDAPSTLGIVGRYLIPRSTFSVLPTVTSSTKDGEIRLIDALLSQLKNSLSVFGYLCEGKRLDTGTPESYERARIDFQALAHE